jgi:hypothetical protein
MSITQPLCETDPAARTRDHHKTLDCSIEFCRIKVPAPDARLDLTRSGSVRRSDPISTSPSRFIEVFPELRRRCCAQHLSSAGLINADFIAEADFISVEYESFSAFVRIAYVVR